MPGSRIDCFKIQRCFVALCGESSKGIQLNFESRGVVEAFLIQVLFLAFKKKKSRKSNWFRNMECR